MDITRYYRCQWIPKRAHGHNHEITNIHPSKDLLVKLMCNFMLTQISRKGILIGSVDWTSNVNYIENNLVLLNNHAKIIRQLALIAILTSLKVWVNCSLGITCGNPDLVAKARHHDIIIVSE